MIPVERLHFTFVHNENWTFKTTLCWRFLKKLLKRHSRLSFIPICFNSYISQSCHILSKTLDMSRKTPLTSKPLSKKVKISWVIYRSWFIQEPPRLNPACFGQIRLFPTKYFNILSYKNLFVRILKWYVRKSCYRLKEEKMFRYNVSFFPVIWNYSTL